MAIYTGNPNTCGYTWSVDSYKQKVYKSSQILDFAAFCHSTTVELVNTF